MAGPDMLDKMRSNQRGAETLEPFGILKSAPKRPRVKSPLLLTAYNLHRFRLSTIITGIMPRLFSVATIRREPRFKKGLAARIRQGDVDQTGPLHSEMIK